MLNDGDAGLMPVGVLTSDPHVGHPLPATIALIVDRDAWFGRARLGRGGRKSQQRDEQDGLHDIPRFYEPVYPVLAMGHCSLARPVC
jgi:hypothetical protein